MPIAFQLSLSGNVVSQDSWATFVGSIQNPAEVPATFIGTIDASAMESYTAGTTWHYFRVRLGDTWIAEADLVGDLEISGGIDSPMRTFRFGLRNIERWGIFITEQTWTRTPVEVWTFRGSSPSAMLPELEISGYVLTSDQDDDQIRVRCGDRAALFDRFEVCREVEPFAGKTRGQHVEDLLRDAGITNFEIPAGAIYRKPVQAANRRLFDYLADFIEPEGWSMRWRGEVLEFQKVELKAEPQPPDDVWTSDTWEQIRIQPPQNGTASRWILRGSAPVVFIDEQGLETEINETVVEAPYRQRQAVERQLGDGEIVPINSPPSLERDRVISRIVDEQVTRAGQVIRRDTKEWRWYNKRVAGLRFAGGFTSFESALIDEDGNYVRWLSERFVLVNHSISLLSYNEAGDLESTRDTQHEYHVSRTQGITGHGGGAPTGGVAYIHADDQSYNERGETFSKSEELITRYEYDATTGAQVREIRDRYAYYSPRCRVSGSPVQGWYNLHNGEAQIDLVANWRHVERVTASKRLSEDGAVLGETSVQLGYKAPNPVWGGAFEWGGVTANQEVERFRFIEQTTTRYNILSEDQYEIFRRGTDGALEVETVAGKLPLPRFTSSAWTRYRQQPVEVVLEDETVEAWFGFERQVLESEFVQSLEEARALLERRIRRALTRRVEIVRPRTLAREGDTVLLVDPRHGLAHRGLIVRETPRWDLRTGAAVSAYELEVYL